MEADDPLQREIEARAAAFKKRVKVQWAGALVPLAQVPLDHIASLRAALPVVGRGVEARASTIEGAGNGLFAARDFAKNEIVTWYSGAVIRYVKPELLDPDLISHARSLVNMYYTILGNVSDDGKHMLRTARDMQGRGGGPLINAPADPRGANVEFEHVDSAVNERGDPLNVDPHERLIVIVAKRAIAAGEELFVSYGKDYWERAAAAPLKRANNTLKLINVPALLVSPATQATGKARRVVLMPTKSSLSTCAYCSRDDQLTGACAACQKVAYCSAACFDRHRGVHVALCTGLRSPLV